MIVTRAGGRALRLMNEPYFKALPVWAYDPDPDHREAFLRRVMRALLGQCPKAPNAPVKPQEQSALPPVSEQIQPSQQEVDHEHDNVVIFPGNQRKDR